MKEYFESCCYKRDSISEKLIRDDADKNFWYQFKKYGVSLFPYTLDIEADMDEYGGYDSHLLEELGFKGCDMVKMGVFRLVYEIIHWRRLLMKFQQLKPWIMGNESITPQNFYGNLKPCMEMGAFIGLDVCCELYLANTIDTGNLHDTWMENKEYIEKVCEITGTSEECGYDLDNEEKRWILEELGEPPKCCYNVYFITIYNDDEEKLVYVGKTDSRTSRFSNGHLAALKLHNPKYQNYYKRIYFGTIMFLSDTKEYVPLEFITPFEDAKRYLGEMEAFLIDRLQPELNIKSEDVGELKDLGVVHIQNFSDISDFMNDYFIY